MTRLSIAFLFAVTSMFVAGSSRGDDKIEADFSKLLTIAERYDLPQPPKEAALVLANTGWTSIIGNSSTSHDPGIYQPAFVLEKISKSKTRVLMGWTEKNVATSEQHNPATRPYSLTIPPPKLKGYVAEFNNLPAFVTAVQLARRNELGKAKAIWSHVANAERFSSVHPHENDGQWLSRPTILLARCIYEYLENATLKKDADLKAIHKKLAMLKQEFPILFSSDKNNYYAHRKHLFLRDLGLTISAPQSPADSVEELLIKWGDRTTPPGVHGYFDENDNGSNQPARAIFRQGLSAITDLQKLENDTRLTRQIRPAIMNSPLQHARLGELAAQLEQELLGSQQLNVASAARKEINGERKFFERAAITSKNGKIVELNTIPLWILGQSSPQSLLNLCASIPTKLDTNGLFKLSDAIVNAKLSRENKVVALVDIFDQLDSFQQKRSVLQRLAVIDQKLCLKLARPVLESLPIDIDGEYWTSEAANYTHVVIQLEDDSIWRDYLRIAKQASVGLRMEMMNPMNYTYIEEKNRNRRLAFLAEFLNDTEIRDSSVHPEKFSGPCAGFTFEKITVRNFAAMKLASILNIKTRPTEVWSENQWSKLRNSVQLTLENQRLPDLTK